MSERASKERIGIYSLFLFNFVIKKRKTCRVHVELTVPPLPSVKAPYFSLKYLSPFAFF